MNQIRKVPPLPATTLDMLANRRSMQLPNLNNYVEDIHKAIFEDPRYRRLLEAVTDAGALEGSLKADDLVAAMMVREYAADKGVSFVKEQNLESIAHAIRIVLRRFQISRNERRNAIGDEDLGDELGGDE